MFPYLPAYSGNVHKTAAWFLPAAPLKAPQLGKADQERLLPLDPRPVPRWSHCFRHFIGMTRNEDIQQQWEKMTEWKKHKELHNSHLEIAIRASMSCLHVTSGETSFFSFICCFLSSLCCPSTAGSNKKNDDDGRDHYQWISGNRYNIMNENKRNICNVLQQVSISSLLFFLLWGDWHHPFDFVLIEYRFQSPKRLYQLFTLFSPSKYLCTVRWTFDNSYQSYLYLSVRLV